LSEIDMQLRAIFDPDLRIERVRCRYTNLRR
jgi:hypothetical protein